MQELNASHSPLPWTYRRGPEYWEERLREHFIARGVNVTDTYLKYWWRAQARCERLTQWHCPSPEPVLCYFPFNGCEVRLGCL